uniref:Pecanex-like protein n=1 Tax=Steinernema glaseri TaxID=37863 RepID=A0A1I8AIR2_9BILA
MTNRGRRSSDREELSVSQLLGLHNDSSSSSSPVHGGAFRRSLGNGRNVTGIRRRRLFRAPILHSDSAPRGGPLTKPAFQPVSGISYVMSGFASSLLNRIQGFVGGASTAQGQASATASATSFLGASGRTCLIDASLPGPSSMSSQV